MAWAIGLKCSDGLPRPFSSHEGITAKKHLDHATGFVQETVMKLIAALKESMRKMDATINDLITAHEPMSNIGNIVLSALGVGPVMWAVLSAHLPELGHLYRNAS